MSDRNVAKHFILSRLILEMGRFNNTILPHKEPQGYRFRQIVRGYLRDKWFSHPGLSSPAELEAPLE